MRTIPLFRKWPGDGSDIIGRLIMDADYAEVLESVPCNATLDFQLQKQDDGTLRIVAARIVPEPALPSVPS